MKSVGLHEKHAVATWNFGNQLMHTHTHTHTHHSSSLLNKCTVVCVCVCVCVFVCDGDSLVYKQKIINYVLYEKYIISCVCLIACIYSLSIHAFDTTSVNNMNTNISEFYKFLDGMVAQFIRLPQA